MIKRHITIIKLICYFIIAPVVVWNLTIGKSLSLWKECEKNKKELDGINTRKDRSDIGPLQISENGCLIDSIARDKNIEIVKYNRYITASTGNYSLIANVLTIGGDYFKMLDAINQMEKTWQINSLTFQTEMNYKTRKKKLNAMIVTQEILKTE